MSFRVSPLPMELALAVRRNRRSPQYGHPVHGEVAGGYGPCRLCLGRFEVGRERRLLFTYQPFPAEAVLPAPGPVFIHEEACVRFAEEGFPPALRGLPLAVEGFDADGRSRALEPVGAGVPESVIDAALSRPSVAYAHLRNAEAGCFIARVDRA